MMDAKPQCAASIRRADASAPLPCHRNNGFSPRLCARRSRPRRAPDMAGGRLALGIDAPGVPFPPLARLNGWQGVNIPADFSDNFRQQRRQDASK